MGNRPWRLQQAAPCYHAMLLPLHNQQQMGWKAVHPGTRALQHLPLADCRPPAGHALTHRCLPACHCSTQEERLSWEQWLLDISILGGPAGASSAAAAFEEQDALAAGSLRAQRRQRVQAAIEECLTSIVRHGTPAVPHLRRHAAA